MGINDEELKKRIMNYRIKHNIIQKEMAKLLGVSETTLIHFFKKDVTKPITKMQIQFRLDELEKEDK